MSTRKVVRFRDQSMPVMEELSLKVGISSVKPTKSFRYITRVIFGIQWSAAAISFAKFSVDTALAKGLQIKYGQQLILHTGLKSLNDFADLAYDTRIDSDAQATPQHHMVTRLSFSKITRKAQGIFIGQGREISIEVQDDLSSSSNGHIHAMLQGWRI